MEKKRAAGGGAGGLGWLRGRFVVGWRIEPLPGAGARGPGGGALRRQAGAREWTDGGSLEMQRKGGRTTQYQAGRGGRAAGRRGARSLPGAPTHGGAPNKGALCASPAPLPPPPFMHRARRPRRRGGR